MTVPDWQGSALMGALPRRRCLQLLPNVTDVGLKFGSNGVICTAVAPPRTLTNYAIIFGCGEVAEWSKAPDSKSGIRQRIVGSNPTLSAIKARIDAGCITERWMSGLSRTPGKRV